MTRLLGALLWIVFLLLALLLYRREEQRRLAEYRGLCHLLSTIRDALGAAPVPLREIFSRFEDEALDAAGFLPLLRKEGLFSALSAGKLHVEKEALAPFFAYAEPLGTRLYSEEKRATEEALFTVTALLKKKEAELPGRQRLSGTLFFSGGMLLLLLLI